MLVHNRRSARQAVETSVREQNTAKYVAESQKYGANRVRKKKHRAQGWESADDQIWWQSDQESGCEHAGAISSRDWACWKSADLSGPAKRTKEEQDGPGKNEAQRSKHIAEANTRKDPSNTQVTSPSTKNRKHATVVS